MNHKKKDNDKKILTFYCELTKYELTNKICNINYYPRYNILYYIIKI